KSTIDRLPGADKLVDAVEELGLVELALHDEALRANTVAPAPVLRRAAGGDENRWSIAERGFRANPLDEREPVHARHLDIDEKERIRFAVRALERFFSRHRDVNVEARRLENAL